MQSSLDVRRIEVADRGYKREDGRLERRNPRKNSQPSLDRADARKQVAGAGGPFQQCPQLALGDLRDVARGEDRRVAGKQQGQTGDVRSEEHTSELQSLLRIAYAVSCLKK